MIVLSSQALQRLPYYLQYLKKLQDAGTAVVAAPAVASALGLNEVQVRKDLAAVSPCKGKPKTGFIVSDLIANMEEVLGYRNTKDAVLVGAGSLGRALLSYRGFESYGLHILAAFDIDERILGTEIHGKPVFLVSRLSEMCQRLHVLIGIIAVPAEAAQDVCDELVRGGILAIWNFAPAHIAAPKNILIKNENMAASLAVLSKHLEGRSEEASEDTGL
ncbi:MAG TPA: redox-sensing transcriptional repressor Rex [Clostridia bacterium]|nr:redox-sensing transcriptional repressor Rex [Clostridia bacterium]